MINVIPIQDMLIIEAFEEDDTLNGFLHEDDKEQAKIFGRGIIISTGPGATYKDGIIPMSVDVGDDVIFLREKALVFRNKLDDKFYLVSERDTSGILLREPTLEEVPGFIPMDTNNKTD